MSEPWIKVYAADMRGDQKVNTLTIAERYLLIQAWDLAKNGPGPQDELRNADESAMNPRDFSAQIAGLRAADATRFFDRIVRLRLAEPSESGALRFPRLTRRQGIDPTGAERVRRHRERKRNAPSNGSSNANVTAQKLEARRKTPHTPRTAGGEDLSWEERQTRAAAATRRACERDWRRLRGEMPDPEARIELAGIYDDDVIREITGATS